MRRYEVWGVTEGVDLRERFGRELEPHFRVEETVLLPALERIGELEVVQRTRRDHAELRELAAQAIDGAIDAARGLGRLLEEHVRFEERELFPLCERRLPSAVLDEVARLAPKS